MLVSPFRNAQVGGREKAGAYCVYRRCRMNTPGPAWFRLGEAAGIHMPTPSLFLLIFRG